LLLAVQRNILLVPFTGVNAVDVVLYAAMLHEAERRNVTPGN
jgi:hypothetical protein